MPILGRTAYRAGDFNRHSTLQVFQRAVAVLDIFAPKGNSPEVCLLSP